MSVPARPRTPFGAVLIDLYDTLAWTNWPELRRELEARTGLRTDDLLRGFDLTRPARSAGAFPDEAAELAAVLAAAGIEPDQALVRQLVELERVHLANGVHLWEDSLPVLRELRARRIRTAIVSNCDHATRPIVDRLGLDREADAIVLSFEVGVAKPDPGIYRAALEALAAEPESSAFVDDQTTYCDGAAALGMTTFLIRREDADPIEGFADPGAHRVITDLRALLD